MFTIIPPPLFLTGLLNKIYNNGIVFNLSDYVWQRFEFCEATLTDHEAIMS